MANLLEYISGGTRIDHTPASALTGGQLIQLDGKNAAVTSCPIAADALGSVAVRGVFSVPYVGNACNVGDNVWWDANGTPYGGTTDGAATNLGADGNFWIGTVVDAPAANDATVLVALNVENPTQPAWIGRTFFKSDDNIVMVEATHSGGVVEITVTEKAVLLPTGVVGMEYIIVNRVVDGGLIGVALDGTEIVRGANLTVGSGEAASNTAETSIQGDYLHLVCTEAATAWRCIEKRGIWAAS